MDIIITVVNLVLVGMIATAILRLIVAVTRAMRSVKEQTGQSSADSNNVIIRVEVIEHNGKDLFLIYESIKNQFLFQTNTVEEIRDIMATKFKDKTVTILTNSNQTIPFLTLKV